MIVPRPAADEPEPELILVVTDRRDAADGVCLLDLRDPIGAPLPAWAPGAHLDLLLAPGLIRQYSLCGDPADRATWRIAVLREPEGRGGSRYVHDHLTCGAAVRIRGPRNHFAFEPADRYLFIAGGIGITPLLPMIATADAAGAEWTLTYGGRSRSSMAFSAELAARHAGRVLIWPQDDAGLLDLDGLLGDPQPGTLVYCCGPEPLLAAVESRCASWPASALHVERFAPHRAVGSTRNDARERAFEVELAQARITLTVPPGQSILQAVEAAGVTVLFSCTEGTCGTCETTVLDGTPDHRDSVLTPEEKAAGDTIMICVSRSATPCLVLDL